MQVGNLNFIDALNVEESTFHIMMAPKAPKNKPLSEEIGKLYYSKLDKLFYYININFEKSPKFATFGVSY